jgi:hypothetical protein
MPGHRIKESMMNIKTNTRSMNGVQRCIGRRLVNKAP